MDVLTILKALSDETRLRIVILLNGHELNVNEIVDVLDMGQSRISRHLKILSDAGILSCRKDGLWAFYTVVSGNGTGDFLMPIIERLNGGIYESDSRSLESYMEEKSEKGRAYFDRVASKWDSIRGEILGGIDLNREIIKSINKSKVTADLGCGNGELAALLLERSEKVIGVDRSTGMLDMARKNTGSETDGRLDFRLGELSHLPVRDGEVDTAVINLVLHYLDVPAGGIDEAARILKKGGRLIIADLSIHKDESMRSRFGHRWLGFSDATIREWMKQYGLKVDKVKNFRADNGLEPFIYVCSKI